MIRIVLTIIAILATLSGCAPVATTPAPTPCHPPEIDDWDIVWNEWDGTAKIYTSDAGTSYSFAYDIKQQSIVVSSSPGGARVFQEVIRSPLADRQELIVPIGTNFRDGLSFSHIVLFWRCGNMLFVADTFVEETDIQVNTGITPGKFRKG